MATTVGRWLDDDRHRLLLRDDSEEFVVVRELRRRLVDVVALRFLVEGLLDEPLLLDDDRSRIAILREIAAAASIRLNVREDGC